MAAAPLFVGHLPLPLPSPIFGIEKSAKKAREEERGRFQNFFEVSLDRERKNTFKSKPTASPMYALLEDSTQQKPQSLA